MKITELKDNQVVHCKTHEESKRVLKLAHEAGMRWSNGVEYIKKDCWDCWEFFKENTCYNFYQGKYGSLDNYARKGLEIITSEKITDMENKTEFFEERIMEVSEDGTTWYTRVVFGKKNGKYIAWINATTVEEAKKIAGVVTWKFARETDPFMELKKAYAMGEDIQCRHKTIIDIWQDTDMPAWNESYEYRIKPKTKYVPFTFEDAELFMNRILIAKDKSRYGVITYAKDEVVVIGRSSRSYKWLFDEFTFLDGSPCGKEVVE